MSTPAKYTPDPEPYETKAWLYEQYWGELRSQNELAAQTNVSRKKIRTEMAKHGIPTRGREAGQPQSNPFACFYGPGESPPAPENTQEYFSRNHEQSIRGQDKNTEPSPVDEFRAK